MNNRQFLRNEYRKAIRKGYYYYAWIIFQNMRKQAFREKLKIEFSGFCVTEEGYIAAMV
ncbi:MAG: hypothetical protein ACM3RX_04940 [Methanococcaceae archaeon]